MAICHVQTTSFPALFTTKREHLDRDCGDTGRARRYIRVFWVDNGKERGVKRAANNVGVWVGYLAKIASLLCSTAVSNVHQSYDVIGFIVSVYNPTSRCMISAGKDGT